VLPALAGFAGGPLGPRFAYRLTSQPPRPGADQLTFGRRAEHGLQDDTFGETRLFVLPSTSPANAAVPWKERLRWFRALRELLT